MKTGWLSRALIPLDTITLTKLKHSAIRRGVWFRILNGLERASIDLTIKVVGTVRSAVLANVLTSIVEKVVNAMESKVTRMMREVGSTLAQRISLLAQNWGNRSAVEWKGDLEFIQYLSVMHLNTPSMPNG